MNKTIGILAHVDAGKTTFSEQILYYTKSIKKRGRVDHKDSFLDNNEIERERGITIFSEEGVFEYGQNTYYLIDTPGHMDFSSEMERAIQVMDYAVIIISGVEGIEAHTETLWKILRKQNIPTMFFINKMDRQGADYESIIEEIKLNFTKEVCVVSESLIKNDLSSELIEFLAERDERLLEIYLNDKYDKSIWVENMKESIKNSQIFPCFYGAALKNIGIEDFIENLHRLTYTNYEILGELEGRIYKIKYDEKGNRLTYIKLLKGELKVKDTIDLNYKKETIKEKINEIRIYNGDSYINTDKVTAGQIFAVTGMKYSKAGQGIGNVENITNYDLVPTLKSKVIFEEKLNPKEVLKYFRILEDEDPILNVDWNEKFKEIEIYIMGSIQLEVLKKLVKERFNVNIAFGECKILYKESILNNVYGCGHFEPLRHYAEVYLKLQPGEKNSGITFESICHTDNLTLGSQNLIKTHIFEKEHVGILTGSPLEDIKITLITGRYHNKHTSGGDFREATYRAIRQGLEKAKNVLLEPYYAFKIEVELDLIGKVLTDIKKLKGSFKNPETFQNKVIVRGRGPVSEFVNYSTEFNSFTKGRGKIAFVFDGYDTCHNEKEIIENIGYDKNSDIENTSSSIFCFKGQSFVVKGSEVDKYMHFLK